MHSCYNVLILHTIVFAQKLDHILAGFSGVVQYTCIVISYFVLILCFTYVVLSYWFLLCIFFKPLSKQELSPLQVSWWDLSYKGDTTSTQRKLILRPASTILYKYLTIPVIIPQLRPLTS